MEPEMRPATADVDPTVTAAVQNIRDRFGSEGLRDLIALAQMELRNVEEAERSLAGYAEPAAESAAPFDAADTQAWLAFTEVDADRADDRR
ncbi:hypothetical protein CLV30_110176 [Haloactinopolyspora alba]|uniref:Uncharacterized protein n=1 Tax=Haloactinopolyspora alba TaxID=648780 RepID=A0A2P8DZ93_9ACTN|nr:hypothetical protein [Haloactinopolyspora alba]PSL02521.1 hypothetical protein CLV30_110176 [Haloactinopolyspora alba]